MDCSQLRDPLARSLNFLPDLVLRRVHNPCQSAETLPSPKIHLTHGFAASFHILVGIVNPDLYSKKVTAVTF